jgi:hypothetical protein
MKLITFNGASDYNKINHLPFNRKFSVRTDLMQKMNTYGFTCPIFLIETSLIDGKKKKWLVDGQHRAVTAAFLNIPFAAIVLDIDFKSIEEIVHYVSSLNSAQKPWSISNYVESYNFLGYKEYNTLLKVTSSSNYSVETIATLLSGFRRMGYNAKALKDGKFKANLLNETKYTLTVAAKLSKHGRLTSRMVTALHYVASLKTFDEEKFTLQYKTNAKAIKELKLDDYSDIFSSWLNELE